MDLVDDMKDYIDRRIAEGLESIHDKLSDEMIDMVVQQMKEVTGDVMTCEETMRLLEVGERTLYNWDKEGILQRYRLGGKFYWRYADVIAILESQKKQSE